MNDLSRSGTVWIVDTTEIRRAKCSISFGFLGTFFSVLVTGVVTLLFVPTSDIDFAGLGTESTCLRVARRADLAVVFLDVGSPLQRLKLLVDLESIVEPGGESLSIFSSRLHKSLTMTCQDTTPARRYSQECQDIALVSQNGSRSDQSLVHTKFVFQNERAAYAELQPAAQAGLDGTFRLTSGQTYWLTTTHLCFSPLAPEIEDMHSLNFTTTDNKMVSSQRSLLDYDTDLAFDTTCNDTLENVDVRLFPAEASNEADAWLSLSGRFLYEYGSSVLEKRRRVVEAGVNCSLQVDELEHQRDIYLTDCGLGLGKCHEYPSVPYRRLSSSRIRIDIEEDGNGKLFAEHTQSLNRIKETYGESLTSAIARLFVLLLTAAVVYVRGAQPASSSRWLLTNTIDTLLCRKGFAEHTTAQNVVAIHTSYDVKSDALISVAAWVSRLIVLVYMWSSFVADGQGIVTVFQTLGLCASPIHFLLRSQAVLHLNLKTELPISKLGGPMSIIDVTCAVLMLFSSAPILNNDSGKFDAIGRLLIAVLVSIGAITRSCFSAAMTACLASSARNNDSTLVQYQCVLVAATGLWVLQAVATSGLICVQFVSPAAVSMVRSQTGDTTSVKFAIYLGLLCTALPTFTKTALRVLQHECRPKED